MSENNNGAAAPDETVPASTMFGYDQKTVDDCIDHFTGCMLAAGASEGRARELAMAFAGGMAYFAGMLFRLRAEAREMSPQGPTPEAIAHMMRGQTPLIDDAVGIYTTWLQEEKRPFKFKRTH